MNVFGKFLQLKFPVLPCPGFPVLAVFWASWNCSTWRNSTSLIHTVTLNLTAAPCRLSLCHTTCSPSLRAGFTARCDCIETPALNLLLAASLERGLRAEQGSGFGSPCSSHLDHLNPFCLFDLQCPQQSFPSAFVHPVLAATLPMAVMVFSNAEFHPFASREFWWSLCLLSCYPGR